jgi:glucose-6-phosphate 1-epimerase
MDVGCGVKQGSDGFTYYTLSHASGSQVVVTDYGAHILSWRDTRGVERLFLSEKAVFARGKPIRGGIPLVFPQFGKGELPSHGFARISTWNFVGSVIEQSGAITATFSLEWRGGADSMWRHACELKLEVCLSHELTITMKVKNQGDTPFSFFSALHTYYRVSEVSKVGVEGLSGCDYLDFLKGHVRAREERALVRCDAATDRVYVGSPDTLALDESDTRVVIEKGGLADTVVWNPWLEGAQTISDLSQEEYSRFICVESGNVVHPVLLRQGEEHVSRQTLRAELKRPT